MWAHPVLFFTSLSIVYSFGLSELASGDFLWHSRNRRCLKQIAGLPIHLVLFLHTSIPQGKLVQTLHFCSIFNEKKLPFWFSCLTCSALDNEMFNNVLNMSPKLAAYPDSVSASIYACSENIIALVEWYSSHFIYSSLIS